jgi:hypothetical protein
MQSGPPLFRGAELIAWLRGVCKEAGSVLRRLLMGEGTPVPAVWTPPVYGRPEQDRSTHLRSTRHATPERAVNVPNTDDSETSERRISRAPIQQLAAGKSAGILERSGRRGE